MSQGMARTSLNQVLSRMNVGSLAASAGMVCAAAIICYALRDAVLPSNLSLIFLTAVLFSALRYGLWPSIFTSLLSELVWNFFFLPPKFTFEIDDPQDLLAFILFLIVSLFVSNLAALQKRQSEAIRSRAEATAHLYDFSQKIAAIPTLDALLAVTCEAIGAMLDCGVAIVLEDQDGETLQAADPSAKIDVGALRAALAARADPGWRRQNTWVSGQPYFYLTLNRLSRGGGIVGITKSPASIQSDDHVLLALLVGQASVAIERLQLAKSAERASLEAEMERLRSAMLTSLSHDLRTPLTVIIATHATIKSMNDPTDAATRAELLDRAQAEAERLNRFIGNLLDMTKLESGKLSLRLGPVDVIEAIESAVERIAPVLLRHTLEVDMPMANADFTLLEQVIFNLLDNAAKYAPAPSTIRIFASWDAPSLTGEPFLTIGIADEGPGIPPDFHEAIFDKFTRLRLEDRQLPGTGLGLAICRGFLGAMGGIITAQNRTDRSGAIFTVALRIANLAAWEAAPSDRLSV
jgi:two-component system sensor histidine kinase KdpD